MEFLELTWEHCLDTRREFLLKDCTCLLNWFKRIEIFIVAFKWKFILLINIREKCMPIMLHSLGKPRVGQTSMCNWYLLYLPMSCFLWILVRQWQYGCRAACCWVIWAQTSGRTWQPMREPGLSCVVLGKFESLKPQALPVRAGSGAHCAELLCT